MSIFVNMENQNVRLFWIDIAKGLGIFFVIFGHLVSYGSLVFNWIFSFHMPLFFFLSGYVFKYTRNNIDIYKQVVKNLILPYIVIACIGLIVSLIIPSFRPESIKKVMIETFYYVQPESLHVGQIWFLFCLAVVQILFVWLKSFNIKQKTEYLIIGISFILAFSIGYFYNHFLNEILIFGGYHLPRLPFKLDSALMALFFFYIGYEHKDKDVFSMITEKILNKKIFMLIILMIVNIIFGVVLNKTVNLACNTYSNPLYFLIASLTGIYMIVILSHIINRANIIEFYGKNSLAIFSFHSFFLYAFAGLLSMIYQANIKIMDNISFPLCILGLLMVAIMSIPIPFLYKNTVSKIIDMYKL